MMKRSAGILAYRLKEVKGNGGQTEFFLVHPGGPFFARKDNGFWTIPKGEYESNETPLDAARREFEEETGVRLSGKFVSLGEVKQKGGKIVEAWAIESDFDERQITSNSFEIEWPPKSGRKQSFPEVDKAGWFELEEASKKINQAQMEFLVRLPGLIS